MLLRILQGQPFLFEPEERTILDDLFARIGINIADGLEIVSNVCQLPPRKVGVIRLPTRTVIVEPRHQGVTLKHVLRMYYFVGNSFSFDNPNSPDYDLDNDLYDIDLSTPFVRELKNVVRKGVPSNYIEVSKELSYVKGRIDPLKTEFNLIKGKINPIAVLFEELTIDNKLNKILAAALWKLRPKIWEKSPADFAFLAASLPYCGAEEGKNYLDEIVLNRNNNYCRKALDLARMILKELYFSDAGNRSKGEAFLIDYDLLFEEFVRAALKNRDAKFSNWSSFRQFASFQDGSREVSRSYKPDILYELSEGIRPTAAAIIDAKNKMPDIFSNSDIYQMLFYANMLEARKRILVYPSLETKPAIRLKVANANDEEITIYAVFINVASAKASLFAKDITDFCDLMIDIVRA